MVDIWVNRMKQWNIFLKEITSVKSGDTVKPWNYKTKWKMFNKKPISRGAFWFVKTEFSAVFHVTIHIFDTLCVAFVPLSPQACFFCEMLTTLDVPWCRTYKDTRKTWKLLVLVPQLDQPKGCFGVFKFHSKLVSGSPRLFNSCFWFP